jgi:hypothetical protein
MDEMKALAQWFGENTVVTEVDTAIQQKDKWNINERRRLKERAAFLLAKKLIENDLVAITVVQTLVGDVMRVGVQCVRPQVWCESHGQTFFAEPPAQEVTQ